VTSVNQDTGALRDSVRLLGDAVWSLNRLLPGIVFILVLLSAGVVAAVALTAKGILAILIVIVVVTALSIFQSTKRYGESSLSLVLGLFTVFTVTWTVSRFIAFAAAWLAFGFFALLIDSIRRASELESIHTDTASLYSGGGPEHKEVRKRLEKIGERRPDSNGLLDSAQRATVLRRAAVRGVGIDDLQPTLAGVNTLYTITKADPELVTDFVVAVTSTVQVVPVPAIRDTADLAWGIVTGSDAPAVDVFAAFLCSQRLLHDQRVDWPTFRPLLRQGFHMGVQPADMLDFMESQLPS
jgi:chromate transport protein ChrA